MLIADKVRLLGIVTFDIGEIESLDRVRDSLGASLPAAAVSYAQRNPQFFDVDYSKPLLQIRRRGDVHIDAVDVDLASVPSVVHLAATELKAQLTDALFRDELFVSASGIGCLVYRAELHTPLTTSDIIYLTNVLVKYKTRLGLSDGSVFSLIDEVAAAKDLLRPFVEERRTDYVRRYSMIHLLALSKETLSAVTSSTPLYNAYENEFHALSVRTIEDWQARYPKGFPYGEPNVGLSPAGVLKMNMRNTVFFEHPYDEVEVEDLYYPAMIEVRIWDLLATAQLQQVQRTLSRYEDGDYQDVSPAFVQRLERSGLKTFNELNGFYLSTSKRVRNFYGAAYKEFQIDELLEESRARTDQLAELVNKIQRGRADARAAEVIARQRDLLEEANATAERETGSKLVLNVIGVLVGIALALQIVEAFHLRSAWRLPMIAAFAALYATVYGLGRLQSRHRTYRVSQTRNVYVGQDATATAHDLLAQLADPRVSDVALGPRHAAWTFQHARTATTRTTSRAELTFDVAGADDTSDAILTLETTFDVRRWSSRRPSIPKVDLSELVEDALRCARFEGGISTRSVDDPHESATP